MSILTDRMMNSRRFITRSPHRRGLAESAALIVGPAILDRHVLTLDKAGLLQALAESALAFR